MGAISEAIDKIVDAMNSLIFGNTYANIAVYFTININNCI
jgi:hypothetical protein